ncbi:MAG: inositol polyphosphate 5-phosphatase [Caeruleum heppii]|nr:MAG: inositol polyphosphate 5-phosphatase [Caeruleum heppii]
MVELAALNTVDLAEYRSHNARSAHGTLGLITINNDVFLCVITGASKVATVRPQETVQRIHAVDFHCLNTSEYDQVLNEDLNPYPTDDPSPDGFELGSSQRREPLQEHPCLALKKLLSGGTFYYSTDFDLTNRLQDRSNESAVFDIDSLDDDFLWNSYMIGPLIGFRSKLNAHERQALDASQILTSAIRGFVLTVTIPAATSPIRPSSTGLPGALTLVSRLSCRRAGTRFNARGIDDDGNVANFVETETVLWSPSGVCFSYAQIRGSVPTFWEQATGLLPGQQKIQITRSAEAAQPAFNKHMDALQVEYGTVHVINLLSATKPGEAELTSRYRQHARQSRSLTNDADDGATEHDLIKVTNFDFHAETKGPGGYEAASQVRHHIQDAADGFAYYLSEPVEEDAPSASPNRRLSWQGTRVVLQQEGVFRSNCLDCLDRTNLVQTIISRTSIEAFLEHHGEHASSDFWIRHSSLWADNGDALSRIYAGTGALKSSFTRHGKMSLAGAIADARKSATRMYINNFADKGRQNTIDLLLGRLMGQAPVHLFDPINDHVDAELGKRAAQYSSSKTIGILAGTFNLNGQTKGVGEELSSWLCPPVEKSQRHPAIIAVGFQEIVELSPQQIMSTDPTRRQAWERAVKRTLNEYAKQHGVEEYVLLRSGQLVGTALSVWVKVNVLQEIKNVEGSIKKTGMSGMAGNKGAVAIRLDYANTSLCFVTAHLAAGFANYEERNRDYVTINHGTRFQRNRMIEDHDTIIWLGDFNYRIGLGDEKVRKLIQMGDLEALYENDQLNLQMVAGLTFPFYSEARITFPPTYKYDNGTDNYDTSEKSRIPAWTDRILRKGTNLRQINYGTAPLRFSDHRPVYATFNCTVEIIDETLKEQLSREIYERRRREVGGFMASTRADETEDEDLFGYDAIAPGLPPASSDRQKWWLDNGLPVRSNIRPPEAGLIPNPKRPSNPFTPSDVPEWISPEKPRTPARSIAQVSSPSLHTLRTPTFSSSTPQSTPFGLSLHSPAPIPAPRPTASQRTSIAPSGETKRPTDDLSSPSSKPDFSTSVSSTTRKPAPPVPKKKPELSAANGGGALSPRHRSDGSTAQILDREDDHARLEEKWEPLRPQ